MYSLSSTPTQTRTLTLTLALALTLALTLTPTPTLTLTLTLILTYPVPLVVPLLHADDAVPPPLPVSRWRRNAPRRQGAGSDESCCLCLEDFVDGEEVRARCMNCHELTGLAASMSWTRMNCDLAALITWHHHLPPPTITTHHHHNHHHQPPPPPSPPPPPPPPPLHPTAPPLTTELQRRKHNLTPTLA